MVVVVVAVVVVVGGGGRPQGMAQRGNEWVTSRHDRQG